MLEFVPVCLLLLIISIYIILSVLVDGTWTAFSSYSPCSGICSPGLQASSRNCIGETSGGMTCSGYGLQFQNCSGLNDSYQCDGLFR